ELGVDAVAVGVRDRADRGGDVAEATTRLGGGDAGLQRDLGGLDQLQVGRVGGADDDGERGVGDPAVDADRHVDAEQVTVAQDVVVRQAVQHRVVDRQAQHVAERAAAERGGVVPVAGLGAAFPDPAAGVVFDVHQVDADRGDPAQFGEQLADEVSGHRHPLDLLGGLELDHDTLPLRIRYFYTTTGGALR